MLLGKKISLTFLCLAVSPTVLSSQPHVKNNGRSKFGISTNSTCRPHGSPFLLLKQKTCKDSLSGYSSFVARAMVILSCDPIKLDVCSQKKCKVQGGSCGMTSAFSLPSMKFNLIKKGVLKKIA